MSKRKAGWIAVIAVVAIGASALIYFVSAKDFSNQPSVDATKERLRWVTNQKLESTLRSGSNARKTTMQPRWGWDFFDGDPG